MPRSVGGIRAISPLAMAGEDEADGEAGVPGAGAECCGDVGTVATAEQGDGEVSAGGEGLRRPAGPDLAAVLVERDIADVMALVFDSPVAAGQGEEVFGRSPMGGQAGDAVADLGRGFPGPLADASPLQATELLDMGPGLADGPGVPDVRMLGRVGERPEDAPLNPSMLRFGGCVHDDGEGCSALRPLALLPDRQRRHLGRTRRQGEQGGKRRGRCQLPGRVDCP